MDFNDLLLILNAPRRNLATEFERMSFYIIIIIIRFFHDFDVKNIRSRIMITQHQFSSHKTVVATDKCFFVGSLLVS